MSEINTPAGFGSGEGQLPDSQMAIFSLCLPGGENPAPSSSYIRSQVLSV